MAKKSLHDIYETWDVQADVLGQSASLITYQPARARLDSHQQCILCWSSHFNGCLATLLQAIYLFTMFITQKYHWAPGASNNGHIFPFCTSESGQLRRQLSYALTSQGLGNPLGRDLAVGSHPDTVLLGSWDGKVTSSGSLDQFFWRDPRQNDCLSFLWPIIRNGIISAKMVKYRRIGKLADLKT